MLDGHSAIVIGNLEAAWYRYDPAASAQPIRSVFAVEYLLTRRVKFPNDDYSGPATPMDPTCIGRLYFRDPETALILFDLADYNRQSQADLICDYRVNNRLFRTVFARVIFGGGGGIAWNTSRFEGRNDKLNDGRSHLQSMPFVLGMSRNSRAHNFIVTTELEAPGTP